MKRKNDLWVGVAVNGGTVSDQCLSDTVIWNFHCSEGWGGGERGRGGGKREHGGGKGGRELARVSSADNNQSWPNK